MMFGGNVVKASYPFHGKVSLISHDGGKEFSGLPNPFKVARYHSLVIEKESFPWNELKITAETENKEIMAIRHKKKPIFGFQFHPESIVTDFSTKLFSNILEQCF